LPRAAHSDTEELARAASAEAGMDPAERARLLHQQQENLREVRAAQKRAAKGVGGRGVEQGSRRSRYHAVPVEEGPQLGSRALSTTLGTVHELRRLGTSLRKEGCSTT
jgi:hypothetical protein